MGEKDILRMRTSELRRFHVIEKALNKEMTQREASEVLGVSERQVRRIIRRVRAEGERGVMHQSRGRRSNRQYLKALKREVLRRYRKDYVGFGPTLAQEKLGERDAIEISVQTLRNWLLETGEWQKVRKRRAHRRWRERKHRVGEMVQIDGSHHDWFEGRGPLCVLIAYIDDATSRVFARFYDYEGTLPAMDSFKRYIRRYGLPLSVYLDKHTTYKSNGKPTLDERLAGRQPRSQFERAVAELGVELIHAHSPQAKGRIERLFRTFQDRVIKEMRLERISSAEEANRWLPSYLPRYNRRFSVSGLEHGDMHRRPVGVHLDSVLAIRTRRFVRNDGTISHNRGLYQILDRIDKRHVVVEERTNDTMRIVCDGRRLCYRTIRTRPRKSAPKPCRPRSVKKPIIPAKDHPWRSWALLPG